MEYRDKTLVCVECQQPFVWTAGEQLFYADKNFKNEPKRCKGCKQKRNSIPGPAHRERVETKAVPSIARSAFSSAARPTLEAAHLHVAQPLAGRPLRLTAVFSLW